MIDDLAQSDQDKEYVLTGKNNQVNAFQLPDLQYTALGKLIIYRLKENRDVKILITGKGKTTGTGKTTLAIILAKWVNKVRNYLFDKNTVWKAEQYSFMDIWEYLEKYKQSEKGDTLITDELEYMADRRRHMTDENVKFSQAWSILRYKNVITIGTAPGLSDLEKRVVETADIWLNVVQKGKANSYYLTFDDFEWKSIYRRMRKGRFKESIAWNPIDDDSDYQWLSKQKENLGVPGLDDKKEDSVDETDLNELERDLKNSATRKTILKIYDKGIEKYFTQKEIAEITGVSQQQVSKIKNNLLDEGKISE